MGKYYSKIINYHNYIFIIKTLNFIFGLGKMRVRKRNGKVWWDVTRKAHEDQFFYIGRNIA